ncbi:MAG: hypothetical protein H0V95_08630 [Actinobacteria bacterium]|nr:hypothetical protein [Actinomycetota bacterium]
MLGIFLVLNSALIVLAAIGFIAAGDGLVGFGVLLIGVAVLAMVFLGVRVQNQDRSAYYGSMLVLLAFSLLGGWGS